jgi:hypothetical protein
MAGVTPFSPRQINPPRQLAVPSLRSADRSSSLYWRISDDERSVTLARKCASKSEKSSAVYVLLESSGLLARLLGGGGGLVFESRRL